MFYNTMNTINNKKLFICLVLLVFCTVASAQIQKWPDVIFPGDTKIRSSIKFSYDNAGNRSGRAFIPGDDYAPADTAKVSLPETGQEEDIPGRSGNPSVPKRPPFAYSGWVPGLLFYRYDYLEIMNSI